MGIVGTLRDREIYKYITCKTCRIQKAIIPADETGADARVFKNLDDLSLPGVPFLEIVNDGLVLYSADVYRVFKVECLHTFL